MLAKNKLRASRKRKGLERSPPHASPRPAATSPPFPDFSTSVIWSSCCGLAEKTQVTGPPSPSAAETGTTLSNLERPLQMKCLFERSPGAILTGSRCRK